MENISQWVGIDISKATLDVYIRPLDKALRLALHRGRYIAASGAIEIPQFKSHRSGSHRRSRNRASNSIYLQQVCLSP